jgi:hypothetical protein
MDHDLDQDFRFSLKSSRQAVKVQRARDAGVAVFPLRNDRGEESDFGVITRDNVQVQTEIADAWRVLYSFALQRGRLVVSEIRIFPVEARAVTGEWSGDVQGCQAKVPPGGLTARIAREAVRLGPVIAKAKSNVEWLTRERELARKLGSPGMTTTARFGLDDLADDGATSERHRRTLELHAKAAAAYVEAIRYDDDEVRRRPLHHVKRRLGVGYITARSYIMQARREGLLLGGGRGRTDSSLTERAEALLSKQSRRKGAK